MKITRRALLAAAIASMALPRLAFAQGETIKISVLHSPSATMVISDTTLKDTMLMLIEAQNAKGARCLIHVLSNFFIIYCLQLPSRLAKRTQPSSLSTL